MDSGPPTPREVSAILSSVSDGEAPAERLLPLLYDELRKLARARLARERPQSLQPTALVHEAYLRLLGGETQSFANRAHFFAAAAETMRRILIDRARHRRRQKRGGGRFAVELEEGLLTEEPRDVELLAVDRALEGLQRQDPAMAQVVLLRVFAGLTVEEAAEAMGTSPRSVDRSWQAARAWLRREIEREPKG
ncbi:MAG TPA: ECF-type sigma factor [Thermoanaerobaculia bacterium]|nr:ECF-type sigma factor [Thermoanaerobaculia bacterium]